jgi:hypothetical protein
MNEPATETFDSEAGYRQAIDMMLALAQREIRVFDRDLLRMALEAPERAATIENFLAADRNRRLRMVLHRTDVLERQSPRLLAVIRRFGHAVEVRRTADHMSHLADCLVLADGLYATIRFHADHARGKRLAADPQGAAPYWRRFEDLWEAGEPLTPGVTAGL